MIHPSGLVVGSILRHRRDSMTRAILLGFGLSLVLAAASSIAQTSAPAPKGKAIALSDYRREVLSKAGDPAKGRKLFDNASRTRCITCHAIGGRGGMIGPDLSGAGANQANRPDLLESILEPSAKIHPDYASTLLSLKSGRVVQGLLRPVSDEAVEVVTTDAKTVYLKREEIEEQSVSRVSLMPDGLNQTLSTSEMADLLAYLGSQEPSATGSLREVMDQRSMPHAIKPVTIEPMIGRTSPFHRPVWFGPIPGQPGNSLVIEMQRARLWRVEGADRQRSLFADLLKEITPGEITGLTSVAFHPDFVHNRRYFLKMHGTRKTGPASVLIVERKATPDGLKDSGQPSKLILKIAVATDVHNGGYIAFGPDGYLYIGMGDTGPQGDTQGHGQDPGLLLGKISRIDIDHTDGDRAYRIPADNPFREVAGTLPEIWALGFREPWRFSFDVKTGDLWVGDVGQGLYEEVAIVRRGENHGWNVLEGYRPYSDRFAKPGASYVPPIFAYHHRVGVSVTGGFVYRGKKNPQLVGKYIFGDYETRRLYAIEQNDRVLKSIIEIGRAPERIVSFGVDDENELYIVGLDRGMIYTIDATEANLTPALPPHEVVLTARQAGVIWRYTLDKPGDDWNQEAFDHSAWPEAPGGFGSRGTPGAIVRTEWRSRNIWLRRSFTLPKVDLKTLSLAIHHDEDAEVYLNGVLAATLTGFTGDYDTVPIQQAALAALRPGKNVIAVHCRQISGGQYIDVGLVETKQTSADR